MKFLKLVINFLHHEGYTREKSLGRKHIYNKKSTRTKEHLSFIKVNEKNHSLYKDFSFCKI